MVNPRFYDQRTNRIGDDDRVVVLSSNSENKLVTLVPCSKVLPITGIAIDSDVTLRNGIFK